VAFVPKGKGPEWTAREAAKAADKAAAKQVVQDARAEKKASNKASNKADKQAKAEKMFAKGSTRADISRALDVPERTIGRWLKNVKC
jgi:DNA invertase Pin-like site-specific DNA recombinase